MKLYKTPHGIVAGADNLFYQLAETNGDALLRRPILLAKREG